VTVRAARFGRFELLARIGAGGGGEVLLVADGARRLALKRLLPHIDGAAAAAAFEREGPLAARLDHRNVVHVLEHGHVDGVPYVLMEYVDGKSLHALLRAAGRLPAGAAAFVVREACLALAYLHALEDEHGRPLALVHRDVSPSNLLVSRTGAVKLCDFGIAKATATTATRTVPGFVKGKRGYRSPEQEARVELDARSDVYAVGVVLFEALTGRRPRSDGERPSERAAGVPAALDDICVRACAADRDDRFAGAAEMAAALDDVVAQTGGESELRAIMARWCPAPPSLGEPTNTRTLARLDGGHRWLTAVIVAAALGVAALALTRLRSPAATVSPTAPLPSSAASAAVSPQPPSPTVPSPSQPSPSQPSSPTVPSPSLPSPSLPPPSSAPVTHAASPSAKRPSPSRPKRGRHAATAPHGSDYMPDPFHR
jgi:serine/threonine protein kinase